MPTDSVMMRATVVGHAFEHEREATRLRERDPAVVGERLRGVELLALHLEAAERVD